MPGPLDGVRVVEVGGGKALAYAGKLLRDLGAEVVKVEPPGGDELRQYGPFPSDQPDLERSGLFVYLTAGKRGLRADLDDAAARAALERLIAGADVVLHAFRPSEARRYGFDYETLARGRPRLIVGAVTVFGSSGPYAEWRGYPLHAYAGSGVSHSIGDPKREPINAPLDGTELHHAAPQLAASVAMALLYRDRTGRGQFIDLSSLEAVHIAIWGHTVQYAVYLGHPPKRRIGRFTNSVWGTRKVADGDFVIMTLMDRHWRTVLRLTGDGEWSKDARIAEVGVPAKQRALSPEDAEWVQQQLREHFDPWLQSQTKAELWAKMRAERISFHPVLSVPEVCESDQIRERGTLVEVPGIEPPLHVPAAPYRLAKTPALVPGAPLRLEAGVPPSLTLPRKGGGNDPGWRSTRMRDLEPRDGRGVQPLAGVRVLDLTQVWAGPAVTRYLADYGADVIQVRTGSRAPTTAGSSDPDEPVAWEWIFRNRRSVAMNLQRAEAVELFKRMSAVSDVIVDNYPPRVMPSLGLDYESLCAANPRLIMAALPPAGRSGPWSELVTYGPSLEALYGMKSVHGYPEGRELMESAAELDPTSAGYATFAILSALYHRNRTGEGQFIEVAQGEAGLAGIAEAVIEYSWNGRDLGPVGNTHRVLAPHGSYPALGEDQWIAIACGSDDEWRTLARVAGHVEWLRDARFARAADRRANRTALDVAIAAWTGAHDKWALTRELQAAGVAAFPQLDQLEVLADEHLHERRQHFVLHPRFTASELLNGNAWHLSESPPRLRMPAPELGAHNVEVLGELLGMAEAEVRRLEAEGVLA